jgi:hypothetical protein
MDGLNDNAMKTPGSFLWILTKLQDSLPRRSFSFFSLYRMTTFGFGQDRIWKEQAVLNAVSRPNWAAAKVQLFLRFVSTSPHPFSCSLTQHALRLGLFRVPSRQ